MIYTNSELELVSYPVSYPPPPGGGGGRCPSSPQQAWVSITPSERSGWVQEKTPKHSIAKKSILYNLHMIFKI